jgi:hypothetical protein
MKTERTRKMKSAYVFLTLALFTSAASLFGAQWEYMQIGRQYDRPLDLNQLNELGAQGWELVTCPIDYYWIATPDKPMSTTCVLKRIKK